MPARNKGLQVLFIAAWYNLALHMALPRGTVAQVVPVVSASPVFTMMPSVSVFRRERITPRIVSVVLVVVSAVTLIAVAV